MPPRTLYDKLWDDHLVRTESDGTGLLYIDRHLVHEVTSPQAFAGLIQTNRSVRRPDAALAVADHNVPTDTHDRIDDPLARIQIDTLTDNCNTHHITLFPMGHCKQGIVHVVGPEQGFTLPGTTVVCGDSHTATHGAFGALAFGIGTSEVEHVLATQCLVQRKMRNMRITVDGVLPRGVTAKDMALFIIGRIGTAGGTGHAIEFAGDAVRALSMEGRMTLCNMAIEAGARSGMIAVDDTTLAYVREKPLAPQGAAYEQAADYWRTLTSDTDAHFDTEHRFSADTIAPQVTWGTSPEAVCAIDDCVPDPNKISDAQMRRAMMQALDYMGLAPGTKMTDIEIDTVFIGSCTNARIEDLRAAAAVVAGKQVAARVGRALVVPGSGLVKAQAEREGLHTVFLDAGFAWRAPGCSMCLAMNADVLAPKERCAATSNRNFEGRQGQGGRTHLVSPQMAALAAIHGRFVDIRAYC